MKRIDLPDVAATVWPILPRSARRTIARCSMMLMVAYCCLIATVGATACLGQEPAATATDPAAATATPADIPAHLQAISVTIRAGSSEGSGVVKVRGDASYIWTAAHVVDGLRTVKSVIDPATGTTRQAISFSDAQVIKELNEGGRRVGEYKLDAEVIRYSAAEDLALLKVRKTGFLADSVTFYDSDPIPGIGTRLLHVGSLLGQFGANSMTDGIMSQQGRVFQGFTYDQTTVVAFPGSSGGGVYLQDGRYVGMLVRGAGEGFNLVVPVRRLRAWSIAAGVQWAVDDFVPVPAADELRKLPVEDSGSHFSGDVKELEGTHPRDLPLGKPSADGIFPAGGEFPFLVRAAR